MRPRSTTVKKVFDTTLSDKPWCPPGIALIGAHRMWAQTRGECVVVGIIDTGVDYRHPDLRRNVIGGRSFIPGVRDFMDDNGHGTHVAGIIAANGRLLGAAPKAKILVAKALDSSGGGYTEHIIRAMEWLGSWRGPAGEKVTVINCSFGTTENNQRLHEAVRSLVMNGVTIVAAAGNARDGRETSMQIEYPAYWIEVLAVGAVDLSRRIANFSNANDHIAVVAPGVETYSTYPGGKYVALSGTSMAAPHIAGACALIHSRHLSSFSQSPDAEWTYRYLEMHTIDLGKVGYDNLTGFGLFSFDPMGGRYLRLTKASREYFVNEERARLAYPLLVRDRMAFMSAEDISRALGVEVAWAEQNDTLEIWN